MNIGDTVAGRYHIESEIGRGAMGIVFKTKDVKEDRTIALKVLKSIDVSDEVLKRFAREAHAAGRLAHPNIVRVYDSGEVEGGYYIAMEFVDGETLLQWFERHRVFGGGTSLGGGVMSPGQSMGGVGGTMARPATSVLIGKGEQPASQKLLRMVEDAARGLHHAHINGIIHRDVKPQNILITKEGLAKIADFGLAKEMDAQARLTISGTVLGTPYYMAPEQAKGDISEIDARSDVYSLGAILYEAFAGAPPFIGWTVYEVLEKIINEEVRPPHLLNRKLEKDVENIVLKALEKNKLNRYQSAEEIANDIGGYLAGMRVRTKAGTNLTRTFRRVRKTRHMKIAVAAMVVVLLVVAAYVFYITQDEATRLKEASLSVEAAKVAYMKYDLEGAEREANNAINLNPGEGAAYYWRGCVAEARGDALGAKADFMKAVELLMEGGGVARIAKAKVDLAGGNSMEALKTLAQVPDDDSYGDEARSVEAAIHISLGEFDKAIELYSRIVEKNPSFLSGFVNRASAYAFMGEREAALADLGSVLDEEKACVEALYNRASLHFMTGDFESAVRDMEEFLNIAGEHPYAGRIRMLVERVRAIPSLLKEVGGLAKQGLWDQAIMKTKEAVSLAEEEGKKGLGGEGSCLALHYYLAGVLAQASAVTQNTNRELSASYSKNAMQHWGMVKDLAGKDFFVDVPDVPKPPPEWLRQR